MLSGNDVTICILRLYGIYWRLEDLLDIKCSESVGDKVYYESTDLGLYDDSFVEYVLDLPEWKAKYGSTDRIIIIPMRDTSSGKKLCANRALLLNPMDSCTNYVGVE